MNEVRIDNANPYPRSMEVQGDGQDVGAVVSDGVSGPGKTGDSGASVGLVMTKSGAPLPSANGTGGKNVLQPPRTVVGDTHLRDAQNSLFAFLEGLTPRDGQETEDVGNAAQTRTTRRDEDKRRVKANEFDLYEMFSLFDTSNDKRSNIVTKAKMLGLSAARDNVEKRAEATKAQKLLGVVIASLAFQFLSGVVSAASNFAKTSFKMNPDKTPMLDSAGNLQVKLSANAKKSIMDGASRLLSFGSALLKYFEDNKDANRRAVRENQADAVREGLQELKAAISHFGQQIVQMQDKTAKTLASILDAEDRAVNNITV